MTVAAVVIGRNEGQRLIACLQALSDLDTVIYVDSGSTDGSIKAAQRSGAQVIRLDMDRPFTAARARNAGLAALGPDADLVQFLDGDCVLQEGWLSAALAVLKATPEVAVVCGRRRETFPQASIYNAVIDAEWDTPLGEALSCGGDALMRVCAVRDVGGYNAALIAGEEPDLCLRLRQKGWRVWRLDAEMTAHDAAVTRFGQWWQRTRRAGYAFAEGAARHGHLPERHWVRETRRALIWGLVLPLLILGLAVVFGPAALLVALIYPAQMIRLSARHGIAWGVLNVTGKFAEAQGATEYHWRRLRGGKSGLIEYK